MDSSLDQLLCRLDINGNESRDHQLHPNPIPVVTTNQLNCFEQWIHQKREESLEEENKSWEGLQTREDQLKSQNFLNALQFSRAVICPNCKTIGMKTIDGYLVCISCGIRFRTQLSIEEIIERMYQILSYHSMTQCMDSFPQFVMFKSNLRIYCQSCQSLNHFIL